MHLVDRRQLAGLLADVVKTESPVHWIEASRRVLDGAGVQRFGSRIQQAFEEAVAYGVARKLFVKRHDFLWGPTMTEPPVRNREKLSASSRKLEYVAPEENRRAILTVVQQSCGIQPASVPDEVCRLLGFARVTADMAKVVAPHRDALVREGRLTMQGLNLILPRD